MLRQTGSVRKISTFKSLSETSHDVSLAEQRLYKFLRLLKWMGTAPWSNVDFGINTLILNRLTASHLHLITGKLEFDKAPRAALFKAISPKMDLQGNCLNYDIQMH